MCFIIWHILPCHQIKLRDKLIREHSDTVLYRQVSQQLYHTAHQHLVLYDISPALSYGDEFRLAKWTISQMGRVSNELASCRLPNRTDDAFKAQMFLGYLARPEFTKSVEEEKETTL